MHVRFKPTSLLAFALLVLGGSSSAFATSTAVSAKKSAAASALVCQISGKFIEAKTVSGKIAWMFNSIPNSASRTCNGLTGNFAVVIPSGSYSTLSNSNVYPVSITEPKPGDEVELRIEYVRPIGWLLSGDNAVKVKR